MNVGSALAGWARHDPDRSAILFEGRRLSYGALDDLAGRVAGALKERGVGPGDRVALHLPNIPEFVACYLGTLRAGAVAVSVNPSLTAAEVGFLLDDSEASVCFTTESGQEAVDHRNLAALQHVVVCEGEGQSTLDGWLRDARPGGATAMNPGDPAAILYTSGTTGKPKGATLTHGNIESNAWATVHHCGYRPEDRLLLFLPLFHVFGQNFLVNSGLRAGSAVVLHRRYVQDDVLESLKQDQVTKFFGVPTIYINLLAAGLDPEDLGQVGYEFSAAATLPDEIGARWEARFGRPIFEGYGLTETSPFACYNHDFARRPETVGTAIENFELRIVDESGFEVEHGRWGEIVIRGPGVMKGYWRRPEDTARAIRDGWFFSGDVGTMDDDGYVSLVDRVKDMINVSGFKVWPAEVEEAFYSHPAVLEAAVYGVADPVRGERVLAAVTVRPGQGVDGETLRDHLSRRLARYKLPEAVEIVDQLPKGATGKILKRELRERSAASPAVEK
jgi:long-chain acyl-CoA synthetase